MESIKVSETKCSVALKLFYADLEQRCKNFNPISFGAQCVEFMRKYKQRKKYAWAPQFQIAHMIEANAAFFRGNSKTILSENDYRKIKNVFHNHKNPALEQLIQQDISDFMLVMHRQQMELQKDYDPIDLARLWVFFERLTDSKLDKEFFTTFGLSALDWFKCGFSIFCIAFQSKGSVVSPHDIGEGVNLDPESMQRFLDENSLTIKEVGHRYTELRKSYAPRHHIMIRSAFIANPIMKINTQSYIVPFPSVLFHQIINKFHEKSKALSYFSNDFGASLEHVVERSLGHFEDTEVFENNRELERMSTKKSCDFLLQFSDFILLVESKATQFTRDIITPSTISEDNSTRKIVRAYKQIIDTAKNIRSGVFDTAGVDRNKPIFPIITTLGEIPFVNAPWYRSKYIYPSLASEYMNRLNDVIGNFPEVMSIRSLDFSVILTRQKQCTFRELVDHRSDLSYGMSGDWDAYIEREFNGKTVNNSSFFPDIDECVGLAFDSLGATQQSKDELI